MAGVPDVRRSIVEAVHTAGRCHVERRLAQLALAGEGWDG